MSMDHNLWSIVLHQRIYFNPLHGISNFKLLENSIRSIWSFLLKLHDINNVMEGRIYWGGKKEVNNYYCFKKWKKKTKRIECLIYDRWIEDNQRKSLSGQLLSVWLCWLLVPLNLTLLTHNKTFIERRTS